jgi:ubiquinone biosynthesis protein UbiJ
VQFYSCGVLLAPDTLPLALRNGAEVQGAAGAGMSDGLKQIAERLEEEDYAEPAKQDIAHLLSVLYAMERENEKLRERVRQLNEDIDRYLS